jgi:hypothetical protein
MTKGKNYVDNYRNSFGSLALRIFWRKSFTKVSKVRKLDPYTVSDRVNFDRFKAAWYSLAEQEK